MNKTTTVLTDAIIKGREIASEHPYKIVGKPDTYNQYNEAWQDCADRYEQLLISLLQKEREYIENAYVNGFKYARLQMQKVMETGDTDSAVDAITETKYFNQSFTQYKTETNE